MAVVLYELIPRDPFLAAFYDGSWVSAQELLEFMVDEEWTILNVQFDEDDTMVIQYTGDPDAGNRDTVWVPIDYYLFMQDGGVAIMAEEPFEYRYVPVAS